MEDLENLIDELPEEKEDDELLAKLEEELSQYSNPDELLASFRTDAARQIIKEMKTAKASKDRRAASEALLNRTDGKPVERTMNISMEVNQYNETQTKNKIEELLDELGYVKRAADSSKILIGTKGPQGQKPAQELPAPPGVSGSVPKLPSED